MGFTELLNRFRKSKVPFRTWMRWGVFFLSIGFTLLVIFLWLLARQEGERW